MSYKIYMVYNFQIKKYNKKLKNVSKKHQIYLCKKLNFKNESTPNILLKNFR